MEEMMMKRPEGQKDGLRRQVRKDLATKGFVPDPEVGGLTILGGGNEEILGNKEVEAVGLPIKPDEIIERAVGIAFKEELDEIQRAINSLNKVAAMTIWPRFSDSPSLTKMLRDLRRKKDSLIAKAKAKMSLETAKKIIRKSDPQAKFEVVEIAS